MATRILLVEDEPILISLYTLALGQRGYDVRSAGDLTTAEHHLAQTRPHVILLDLMIPSAPSTPMVGPERAEPVGFRILRHIKSTPHLAETRVLILSNLDSDEHIRLAESLGADEYILKADLDPRDLSRRVESVLARPPRIVQLG